MTDVDRHNSDLGALLTPAEVAARLHVSRAALTDWRHRGRGPAWLRVGRLVRYPAPLLDRWLQEQLQTQRGAV